MSLDPQRPDDLRRLGEHYEAMPQQRARYLALALVAPWLLVAAFEWASMPWRSFGHELPQPLQRVRPYPFGPGEHVDPEGWGDLYKGGAPRSERLLGQLDRTTTTVVNQGGFRGPDHGPKTRIWVFGASFFEKASTDAQMFGSQLQQCTGQPVTSRAWPGRGPEFAILHGLLEPQDLGAHKPVVLWAVTARILLAQYRGEGMARVVDAIDAEGHSKPRHGPGIGARLRQVMGWHRRLEGWLADGSDLRRLAMRMRRFVPPLSLDPVFGDVLFVRLRPPLPDVPFLIYKPNVQMAHSTAAQRGDAVVLEGFRRVKAYYDRLGVPLVVVLVPDKFQLYCSHLQPDLRDPKGAFVALSSHWAKTLDAAGVLAIDLGPALQAAQLAQPERLLYRQDDTHWNDDGIRIGAAHVARRLAEMGVVR